MRYPLILLLAALLTTCSTPEPTYLIIDADTANEVDDLFALVGALAHTRDRNGPHKLLAITSAQFHTSPLATATTVLESQVINEDLVRLTDRPDVATPVGSNLPLMNATVPAVSPASTYIIQAAHEYGERRPVELFILGSCTNVASAVLQDPTIIPKIKVNYLGFWHDTLTNTFDLREFNSGNDTFAVRALLGMRELDFQVMTATTSQHLVFQRDTVARRLVDRGPLGDYLLDRWDTYERWWTDADPAKRRWTMWDVALIEAFFHHEATRTKRIRYPLEVPGRYIRVHTDLDAEALEWRYWDAIGRLE